MPKIEISRELITSIANQDNKKFVKNINKKVNEKLALAIDNLSAKVSYINLKNVALQPVNELISNAFVDNSNCVYFLGIESAQLEMNTNQKVNFWKNFKERLKFAWDNRKYFNRRKRKKRRRKKIDVDSKPHEVNFDPNKYSIYNIAEDMQHAISEYLSQTSIISLSDNMIHIVGREDFGSNTSIVIYFVNLNESCYKYYAGRKKGFIEININKRVEMLNEKINEVGQNFIKMIKVFNSLFYNVNGYMPNQVYIESVLYSCPNDFYEGNDIYKVFIKIVNYLSLTTIRNIKSMNNESKTINEDIVCGNNGIAFNKMLNIITSK